MKQRSEEWFEARRGMITCSRMGDVLAKSQAYADEIGRGLLGEKIVQVDFRNGKWGRENESKAIAAYELDRGVDVQEVGFIVHPELDYVGCSPDGLVGDDGTVEAKCPANQKNHIAARLLGMSASHLPQVQGGLWVTDRQWCDFISFDPRVPRPFDLYVQRIQRDDAYISRLVGACIDFWRMVREGRRSLYIG